MNEGERRQVTISSTPRLAPEEIAGRAFSASFRGVSESEVRAFLRRVAEELAAARERERELTAAVDALEEQLRSPQPIDDQRMLEVLGEETTRLLRTAREASEDIRTRAEERAAAVLKEAQDDAGRKRDEADGILAVRTGEADAVKAELLRASDEEAAAVRADLERHAEEHRVRVEGESESAIEAARTQGREMLEEAKSLRERVLADLGRRRALLQGQIGELLAGRDQLLDAYRVVKRTFLEATEALAQVEARAAAGRVPQAPVSPEELALVEAVTPAESGAAGGDEAERDAGTGAAEGQAAAPNEQTHGRSMAAVDSLFARLREEQASGEGEEGGEGEGAAGAVPGPEPESAAGVAGEPEGSAEKPGEGAPSVEVSQRPRAGSEQVGARDAVLDPLRVPLVKQAKRAAQDEQNEVLDAVRRVKGRATSGSVLVGEVEQVAAWSLVIGPALSEAYAAGFDAVTGREGGREPGAGVVADVIAGLVAVVVSPLRERVSAAVDDTPGAGAESEGLVAERIGARYREWKTQSLETLLGDALAAAYACGAYDASPVGALLAWVPQQAGRCSDCDDNALEPTTKGACFPTGQTHPPAHPGCRCVVLPAPVSDGAEGAVSA